MNIWRLTKTTDNKIAHKLDYMCAIEMLPDEQYVIRFNDMCYIIESQLFERGYKSVELYAHGNVYKFEFQYYEKDHDKINLFEIHGNEDIREWL